MFFLYYLWNLINFLVFINLNFLNVFFLKFNKFNLIFKKPFKTLTFLEKFFLVFFSKKNWFFKSICCFSNFDYEINELRKKNFPIINFFVLYSSKSNITFKNFFIIKTQYNWWFKNNFNFNSDCFKNDQYYYMFYNWLLIQFFFYKKYYNLLDSFFFKFFSNNNLIKLNFIFYKFYNLNIFKKNNFNYYLFNLNYYNDWFNYSFYNLNKKNLILKNLNNKIQLDKKLHSFFKDKKMNYIKKTIIFYKKIFKFNEKFIYNSNYFFTKISTFTSNFLNFLKSTSFKKITFKKFFLNKIIKKLPIRFSDSSVNKYINMVNSDEYNFFFLRKNRIFNKGRYSRNRQLYRTGVYWCLWLNIIIVYGLYFFFYRFTFNFGYIWFGLFILIFSTIFSRIVKYKFYNLYFLYLEFFNLFNWLSLIINNLYYYMINLFFNFNKYFNINKYLFNSSNYLFYYIFNFFNNFFVIFNKKKDYGFVFIWENYKFIDNSFLKHKSILNWFVQLYKVLTY